MELALAIGFFVAGLLLIIKGGDVFVDAAHWVSDATGIPKAIIGATLVSFATTSPEFFVSLLAVIKGQNELSIGNAVGSLSVNLGIAFALICLLRPNKISDKSFAIKGFIMIIAAAALLVFCINGVLPLAAGFALLFIYAYFTYLNIKGSKGELKALTKRVNRKEVALNVIKFAGGAAAIVMGANFMVDNAQVIALRFGVSEAVIGLTIVAIGTSLPEIVTSVVSIIKKEPSISIGNIIGANILDATLILSASTFASGGNLTVAPSTITADLPVALLLMLLAVVPSSIGKKIYRWQGVAILSVYILYAAYLIIFRA